MNQTTHPKAKRTVKSLVNRWGVKLLVGDTVRVGHISGGSSIDKIKGFETTGAYAKAYGPRVLLESGMTCSPDDCIPQGPQRLTIRTVRSAIISPSA